MQQWVMGVKSSDDERSCCEDVEEDLHSASSSSSKARSLTICINGAEPVIFGHRPEFDGGGLCRYLVSVIHDTYRGYVTLRGSRYNMH